MLSCERGLQNWYDGAYAFLHWNTQIQDAQAVCCTALCLYAVWHTYFAALGIDCISQLKKTRMEERDHSFYRMVCFNIMSISISNPSWTKCTSFMEHTPHFSEQSSSTDHYDTWNPHKTQAIISCFIYSMETGCGFCWIAAQLILIALMMFSKHLMTYQFGLP